MPRTRSQHRVCTQKTLTQPDQNCWPGDPITRWPVTQFHLCVTDHSAIFTSMCFTSLQFKETVTETRSNRSVYEIFWRYTSVATLFTLNNLQDLAEICRIFGRQFSGSMNSGRMAANIHSNYNILSLTCAPMCWSSLNRKNGLQIVRITVTVTVTVTSKLQTKRL